MKGKKINAAFGTLFDILKGHSQTTMTSTISIDLDRPIGLKSHYFKPFLLIYAQRFVTKF